jgi:predicted enzyme related to lactoylglutathione lyase
MARVTGIGGVFFTCEDPMVLAAWYRDVLEIEITDWGGSQFRVSPDSPPFAVWAPFRNDAQYFAPSERGFMINFAVDDLEGMLARLERHGVPILGKSEPDPTGRFAWFLDPAGTKIELWEPKK